MAIYKCIDKLNIIIHIYRVRTHCKKKILIFFFFKYPFYVYEQTELKFQ